MTEQPSAYDAFISYSHRDEAWVTGTLLPRLEQVGLRVCVDFRDFVPGKSALLNMQDAALNSRHTVLVLTQDWVDSQWTLFEGLLTRTDDPAGLKPRTVPLRLKACDLPPFIAMLTWVDFTRPDWLDIAWVQLLTALGAPPLQAPPEEPAREQWRLAHPYAMPPNFTGRLAERKLLSEWLNAGGDHPLLMLRALGGFGKSALTWHWLLHDIHPTQWPRAVWWSFYESDAGFEGFLRDVLEYLGADPSISGPRPQADELLRLLRQPGTLLVLDGFERALRAFNGMGAAYQGDEATTEDGGRRTKDEGRRTDARRPATDQVRSTQYAIRDTQHATRNTELDCVSPIAEHFLRSVCSLPGIQGKVLMTTRLRPRALDAHGSDLLQGCREVELTQMRPADAVVFFRAQGVRGGRAEIETACAPYGYHPLSLRLLAGLVVHDLRKPGDIAATRRLDISGDLMQRKHHVLEQAYESLAPVRRQLLSRIACFRGAVDYDALRALAQKGKDKNFDADLRDLLARGLLQHDRRVNQYDLHPIVRRYAYNQLSSAMRRATHSRLRDYFAAVPVPEQMQRLDDLAPLIELYHHTVGAGQYDKAHSLFRDHINRPTLYQFGAYQLRIQLLRALFSDREDQLPQLKNESSQGWTLNGLALSYGFSGHPRLAVPLMEKVTVICEKLGEKDDLSVGLVNLAYQQISIGALCAAESNLRHSVALSRKIGNELNEAIAQRELSRLLACRGLWQEAEEGSETALTLFEKEQAEQYQGVVWAYRVLKALLLGRVTPLPLVLLPRGAGVIDPIIDALASAHRTIELADEWQKKVGRPNAREYVHAYWLLGAAYRASGDVIQADHYLNEALTRSRSINLVEVEADILLDLARLRAATGARDEALRLAQEALMITERSGYVLQGADVNLFLAQMALADRDERKALEYAREARRLARCDGPPDHTYKVAYEEAGALLARLGEPLRE